MTKTLNERVAEKMGWRFVCPSRVWRSEGITRHRTRNLPSFSTDWNATKIVIKFMRERGFRWVKEIEAKVDTVGDVDGEPYYIDLFYWGDEESLIEVDVEIINDDLPLAACESFLLIDLEAKSE